MSTIKPSVLPSPACHFRLCRMLACLPYLLPFFNAISYGRYLFYM